MDPKRSLLRVTAELEKRSKEALRLYVPQPQQEPLFRSRARFKLCRGGNRSGKTLAGAVLCADKMTGNSRFGISNDPRGFKILCVSLDFSLLSDNIYRKLFEPGAFQICKTCRRVRHLCDSTVGGDGSCEQDDSTWKDRQIPAEPLVPPRLIKNIAWREKSRLIPDKAWLKTGATVDFRSTDQGRAKFQGTAWDWFWCDEEATNDEEIMNEILRGLIDKGGGGLITATPLAASLTMVNWHESAQQQKAEAELAEHEGRAVPAPTYDEIQLYTDDNKALERDAIERFYDGMGEEEEAVRRRGEFLVQQGLVYGREFDKNLHIVDTFKIPDDWTIYEVQDPGHAVAFATLYWAVSPDDEHYLIDELYLRRADISDVVKAQKYLLRGNSPALAHSVRPQRSIIDPAARQVAAGMKGQSVLTQIHNERQKQNHMAWQGGSRCHLAHNEVQAGIFAVKALLKPDREGRPRLFVMRHLHHLLREIRRYRWPRPQPGRDLVEKKGPIKKDDHLMDCLRYGALARLEYVPPETRPGHGANPRLRDSITKFLKERKRKNRAKRQEALRLTGELK